MITPERVTTVDIFNSVMAGIASMEISLIRPDVETVFADGTHQLRCCVKIFNADKHFVASMNSFTDETHRYGINISQCEHMCRSFSRFSNIPAGKFSKLLDVAKFRYASR